MVVGTSPDAFKFGTASVIKSTNEFIYFLTNEHVVRSLCDRATGKCDLELLENPKFEFVKNGAIYKGSTGLEFKNVELVKISENPDLAVLKSRLGPKSTPPMPIKLSKNCSEVNGQEKLFSIGFSNVSERYKDSSPIIKRWSSGFPVDVVGSTIFRNGIHYFLGTTVDVIHGGSGGPLLNSQGELIGVLKGTRPNPISIFTGNDIDGQKQFHSLAVLCQQIETMISDF